MVESSTIVETATDVSKMNAYLEHVKQNNVAYLVALFVSHQLGILDNLLLWGSGVCG